MNNRMYLNIESPKNAPAYNVPILKQKVLEYFG